MTIYAVCHSLQEKEITEYCFKKCGKTIIGGINYNNMAWCPCRTEKCPHLERQVTAGDIPFDWGVEELVLRKLEALK